jgi:hypothetical protein
MMKNILKFIIPDEWWRKLKEIKVILVWYFAGRPVPFPDMFKRNIIKKYALRSGARVFVETGTYRGGTVNRMSSFFNKSFSIEVYPPLAEAARKKFKDNPKITIVEGDSSEVLPRIISDINEPIFFWLDSHYSGEGTGKGLRETPIVREMEIIFSHPVKGHMILIDDARLFNGSGDYPGLNEFHEFIKLKNPDLRFEVNNDIIILQNDKYVAN